MIVNHFGIEAGMGTREYDPPTRPRWVGLLSKSRQADTLLRSYLADRIGKCSDGERNAIRSFLRQVGSQGVTELALRNGPRNTYLLYVNIRGTGPDHTRPTLVLPDNRPPLDHIARETGPCGRVQIIPDTPDWTTSELREARPMIPQTVKPHLIPGRKPG